MNNKILITIALAVFFIAVIFLFSFFYSAPKQASVCFNPPAGGCFKVEIAKTSLELSKGLTLRKSLEQNKGMLFIFEKEGNYPFWMKNTLIPLDIIWIDKNGKVVFISENNLPCLPARAGKENNCLSITPNQSAKYVLEINAGISEKIEMKIGDEAILTGLTP